MPCGVFKPRNLRSSAGVSPQELESFFIPNFPVRDVACAAAGLCPAITGQSPVTTRPRLASLMAGSLESSRSGQ